MSRHQAKTTIKFLGRSVITLGYLLLILISSPLWVGMLILYFLWGFLQGPWEWSLGKEGVFAEFSWHPAYKLLEWQFPKPSEPGMSREDAELCREAERVLDGCTYTKLPCGED